MITHQNNQLIREKLKSLAEWHAAAVAKIEETIALLSQMLDGDDSFDEPCGISVSERGSDSLSDYPVAERTTLRILWRGRSCFLGNTLLFRFFERLARSPNRYVSHEDLLEDVWGGPRESVTIRGVAKRLRDRLMQAGMTELAEAIDGSSSSHYGLILVRSKEGESNADRTRIKRRSNRRRT